MKDVKDKEIYKRAITEAFLAADKKVRALSIRIQSRILCKIGSIARYNCYVSVFPIDPDLHDS